MPNWFNCTVVDRIRRFSRHSQHPTIRRARRHLLHQAGEQPARQHQYRQHAGDQQLTRAQVQRSGDRWLGDRPQKRPLEEAQKISGAENHPEQRDDRHAGSGLKNAHQHQPFGDKTAGTRQANRRHP